MSGGLSAGAFTAAAISTAATVGSAVYAGVSATAGTAGADESGLLNALTGKSQAAAQQRSALLATAGQSAGSPLAPGSVGGISNIFGN